MNYTKNLEGGVVGNSFTSHTKGLPALILFGVLLSAAVQNYLGVVVALSLVFLLPSFRRGHIYWGGFAGAFYVAALYVLVRMPFPAAMPPVGQLQEFVRFLAMAVFATAVWRMAPERLLQALQWFFLLMLALFPVYLATGAFSGVDASGDRRFAALMPHANHLGYIAASTALMLIYLTSKRMAPKWSGLMLPVLMGLVLVTRSSGALLVLVLGFAAFAFSLRPTFKRAVLVLAGLFLLFLVIQTPPGQLALEKISAVDIDTALAKADNYRFGNQGSSFAWRISYWTAMVTSQINSGPLAVWLGQGGGAATMGDQLYFFMEKDPHSDFVKLFIEYGVFGGLLIFALLFRAVWATGARLLGLVVFFGPMLTGNSLTSSPVIFVLLCNAALLSAASKRTQ